jgi:hapalindole biogenesis HpiC1 cyclase-like protein
MKSLLLTAVLLAVIPALYADPVVVNGSFESDNWNPQVGDLTGSDITGWTAFRSNSNTFYLNGVNNANAYGDTPYGNQYLVLGPTNVGGNYVEQAVAGFTAGSTYNLSFALSSECYIGNPSSCSSDPHARVRVSFESGSSTASADFLAPSSVSNWWDTWGLFSYTFVANADTVAIRFLDLGGVNNGYDIGLDNVSVEAASAAVPEPSAVLVLCGAMSLIFFTVRGRKRAG